MLGGDERTVLTERKQFTKVRDGFKVLNTVDVNIYLPSDVYSPFLMYIIDKVLLSA